MPNTTYITLKKLKLINHMKAMASNSIKFAYWHLLTSRNLAITEQLSADRIIIPRLHDCYPVGHETLT